MRPIKPGRRDAVAGGWRRRRMCVLRADPPAPACIRELSARGAFLETNVRPPIGEAVVLSHPEAGAIHGEVLSWAGDGIRIGFPLDTQSVAFALTAITADMSRPA